MSIAPYALGAVQESNVMGVGTTTIPSVSLVAGSTLIVAIASDAYPDNVHWGVGEGSVNLSLVVDASGALIYVIYALYNCAGGTKDLVVDNSTSGAAVVAFSATEIIGCEAAPLDKTAYATGSSTAPSSGATPTTSQANELLLGFIGTQGPETDAAGTWQNSFSDGQRVGSNYPAFDVTTSDGYLIVAATGAYTAAKTGITSREWSAAILTFKEAAAQSQAPRSMHQYRQRRSG